MVLLPARFDDTELPGLPSTVAYIDLRTTSEKELVGLILSKLARSPQTPQLESLSEKAARLRREKQADDDRVAFLAGSGTHESIRAVRRLFDTLASQGTEFGVTVERDDHFHQACFHLENITLGVGWTPSEYVNRVDDGLLEVTLWGGRWALRPSVLYSRAKPPIERTTVFRFDVTPFSHQVRWRPETEGVPSLSTEALAEFALRELLEGAEAARKKQKP